jgi:sulfite oxidase
MSTRRELIRSVVGGMVVASVPGVFGRDEKTPLPELIVRGDAPLNAETPVGLLDSWLTPPDRFFVRSHFGPPALSTFELAIGGLVKTPLRFRQMIELQRMDPVVIPAVLQCSGNGRGLFQPTVPGVGWERGAVGNAEWTGVRLKDLLEKAGIDAKAKHVHFLGGDPPPNPKTPVFHRSLPIERAMDPSTLLAFGMNSGSLPRLHGGPIRLVVPGWAGNHWIKWLREITVSEEEAPGFYQRTGYKMPKIPAPAGATVKPEDMVPVTALNVKSLIVSPTTGSTINAGRINISGVAWTGIGRVTKLEVSIDDGTWQTAELYGPDHIGAWRQWRFDWNASIGSHSVRARATDSEGSVQPEKTPWNKSGYLWNGIDTVAFEVRRS